jgi:hypothetical protein
MGGVGSGGYKNSPGDVETHSAWNLVDPLPGTPQVQTLFAFQRWPIAQCPPQKLRQARCKHCCKEMAQHTSRQRTHLLACQAYLDAMKSQGVENSITRQAADPASFVKSRKPDQTDGTEKRKATQRLTDFTVAIRIQALALAEASISYDRIREITGIETKLLDKIRRTAKERGYDPATSMQMKEEYVADPAKQGQVRPKKPRVDGVIENEAGQPPNRQISGYIRPDTGSLPPGNWNFMSGPQAHSGSSLG